MAFIDTARVGDNSSRADQDPAMRAAAGGMLITIDGQSGAGKTTTAGLLCQRLGAQGVRVLLTGTPSPSRLGTLARHGTFDFRGCELTLLVAADRYHHTRTVIRPALASGAVVVCDRYLASSLVLDPLDGVDRDLVWGIYRALDDADLSIILRGDPTRCAARAKARGHYSRFHADDEDANARERAAYADAAALLRRAGRRVLEYEVGDASADEVAAQLTAVICDLSAGRP